MSSSFSYKSSPIEMVGNCIMHNKSSLMFTCDMDSCRFGESFGCPNQNSTLFHGPINSVVWTLLVNANYLVGIHVVVITSNWILGGLKSVTVVRLYPLLVFLNPQFVIISCLFTNKIILSELYSHCPIISVQLLLRSHSFHCDNCVQWL